MPRLPLRQRLRLLFLPLLALGAASPLPARAAVEPLPECRGLFRRQLPLAPGPRGLRAYKTLGGLSKNELPILTDLHGRHGELVRFGILPRWVQDSVNRAARWPKWTGLGWAARGAQRFVFPDFLLLLSPGETYDALKETELFTRPYDSLGEITGPGSIFILQDSKPEEHAEWEQTHDVLKPYLTARWIQERYTPIARRLAARIAAEWRARDGGRIEDVQTWADWLSLGVTTEAFFSSPLSLEESEELSPWLRNALPGIETQATRDRLQGYASALIERRLAAIGRGETPPEDILQGLLDARPARAEADLAWARSQIITLLIAGQETTRTLLALAAYHLAAEPDAAQRLRAELLAQPEGAEAGGPGQSQRPLLQSFLKETLRYTPIVSAIPRLAARDLKIGDYRVPEGTVVYILSRAMHRLPWIWGEDASEFRVDRFVEHKPERGSYLPFGLGPRMCIGFALAMAEAEIWVEELARGFDLALAEPGAAFPEVSYRGGTAKLVKPLPLVARPR